MSEMQKPMAETPLTEPVTTGHPATTATTATEPVTTEPKSDTIAPVNGTTGTSATTATPTEDKVGKDKMKTAEPIYHGALGYKAPGLVNSFRFSKKYFWFGEDEPVSTQNLSHYLRGEKAEIAHPTAAWSSQTGKGLLYFVKHADQKSTPAGVLNLSEASDLVKEGMLEFSFKLHGHKHTFQAKTEAERDGWFVAVEKTIEEAKGKREAMLGSSGYKETVSQLGKPAVLAAAGTTATAAHPKKSTEHRPSEGALRDNASSSSSSSSDAEGKKTKKSKSKSRSESRGKRGSIFGSLLGKKEEHDEKKAERAEVKHETKEEVKAEAPVVAGTSAPLDAERVAARVLNAPADEIKPTTASEVAPTGTTGTTGTTEAATEPVEANKGVSATPKPTKRGSIFGNLMEKVRSPTTEKKQHDFAPTVPPKDTEASTAAPIPSTTEATETAPVDTVPESTTANAAHTTSATTPHKEKESFLGKFLNKAKTPTSEVPPTTETHAAAPATTVETSAAAPAVPEKTEKTETPTTAPTSAATGAHEVKDKRRTSFFGNLTGSIKKDRATSNGEESERKPSGLGGLFRNPSKAMRNNKETHKETHKEAAAPATVGETTGTTAAEPASEPAHVGTDGAVGTSEAAPAAEPRSIGDVTPNAVSTGQAPSSTPAVHAAA